MQLELNYVNKEVNLSNLKTKELIYEELNNIIIFLRNYLYTYTKLKIQFLLIYKKDDKLITVKKEDINTNPEKIIEYYNSIEFPLDSIKHKFKISNHYSQKTILQICRDSSRLQRMKLYKNISI